MKVSCENCHTLFEIPEGRMGMPACPHCAHVNRPQDQAGPSTRLSDDDVLDHSKTMLGPMDGRLDDETTAVQRAVAGRKPGFGAGMEAAFVILEGDGKGRRIPLAKSQITIGRKVSDVVINDPEASRRHCKVTVYPDLAVVKDLGSANGTLVNNRLLKEGLLASGGTIQIGTTVLQFNLRPKG